MKLERKLELALESVYIRRGAATGAPSGKPDPELAQALYDAEVAGDTDAILHAENEICGRLNIPLDETEQGLTQVAADIIDNFLRSHGFTVRGEEATRA